MPSNKFLNYANVTRVEIRANGSVKLAGDSERRTFVGDGFIVHLYGGSLEPDSEIVPILEEDND